MNDKLDNIPMWKEAVVAYFKAVNHRLLEGAEGIREIFIRLTGRDSKVGTPEYEGTVLPTQRLRWSGGERAGLWYASSRVQTRPKPSDFSGEKILSTPSFGGEVKPSVPCRKFTSCKRTQK